MRIIRTRLVLFAALAVLVGVSFSWAQALKPEERRQRFLKIIERPKVEPAGEVTKKTMIDGVIMYRFTFSSEADQRVPGIALVKETLVDDGKRHACVIVLHGTGGNKEGQLPLLKKLAARDFVAVSIDGRFHGQRGNSADYNSAIAKAFSDNASSGNATSAKHPLYFDTVWDVLRLVDLLQTRPEIDPDRIGLIGFSKGGIETWLAAAADTRIAAVVPCISLQSFEWSLQHDGWQNRVGTVKAAFAAAAKSAGVEQPDAAFARQFYDRVIPEIYSTFDGPEMIPLIAPRPLLAISGESDPINPLPGVRLCEKAAKDAYAKANAVDKFELLVEPNTGHGVNAAAEAAAIAWLGKWLNPKNAK